MPGRVSTYLKARTQRRLRGEVVKAKSRQRSRIKGGKRQKNNIVLLEESNAHCSVMFYIGLFSRKSKLLC